MILQVYSGILKRLVLDSLTGQSQPIFLASGKKCQFVDILYSMWKNRYKKIVLDILIDHDDRSTNYTGKYTVFRGINRKKFGVNLGGF
jgi:hypothetical protein